MVEMTSKPVALVVAMSFSVAGCATHSDSISASHVSDVQYANFTCDQIRVEMERVRFKRDELVEKQNKSANTDSAMMGVGMILFWPALFALAATSDNKSEVARIKGEYEAVERASIAKNCAAT
jgi:hypothetical protein